MSAAAVTIDFAARPYQRPVIDAFRAGKKKAYCCWHRKAGKDRVATFVESTLAFQRVGLYWHGLPKYEDARKVIWDAITPTGERLIDINFPKEVIRRRLDHEMKLELVNGSIWQPVGADNFDSLVGAFPAHITYSEYALMSPAAREYLRPALAMNNGTELIITTPRGYNHAHDLWLYAKDHPDIWFTSCLTVHDTNILTKEMLEEERRSMPEELFRQEYEVDWAAANVGSILGRYVEAAEKAGRIADDVEYDPEGAGIEITSDIGRRHISAWWFWQPVVDGFRLIDYDEDSGLDADEWTERLRQRLGTRKLAKLWLPHDARAKTFAAQHSPVETFIKAFGDVVRISPQTKKEHSINAGQVVMRHCRFHKSRCAAGLKALRAWSYQWDDDRKSYSRAPLDDWSCDAADAFCEGAKVMRQRLPETKLVDEPRTLMVGRPGGVTLNDMWRDHERNLHQRRSRI